MKTELSSSSGTAYVTYWSLCDAAPSGASSPITPIVNFCSVIGTIFSTVGGPDGFTAITFNMPLPTSTCVAFWLALVSTDASPGGCRVISRPPGNALGSAFTLTCISVLST